MTFQPVIPGSGLTGWRFLEKSSAVQQERFAASASVKRDIDYFRANISKAKTAEDLVKDRRLLNVALTAFGLEGDINSKAFIKKVLAEGTLKADAFANRLADKRYLKLAQAFGYGDLPVARTQLTTFPDEVIKRFTKASFETAVGAQNSDYRLALNFPSAVNDVVSSQSTKDGRWYAVMGNTPLRSMLETALGLPSSFGKLDLDQQLSGFRRGLERLTGKSEVADLADPTVQQRVLNVFMVRSQAATVSSTSSILNLLR